MIPALLSSVVILYLYWKESRRSTATPSDPTEGDFQQRLAALNARLEAIRRHVAQGD